jgi:integrase/recombinase XerC
MTMTTTMTLAEAVEDYFLARRPRKDSEHTLAAYRRDLNIITGIIAAQTGTPVADITIDMLALRTVRSAFSEFAGDHAKASIQRCWSTWQGFFNHLVAEGLVEGNPMAGVARPKTSPRAPKAFDEQAEDRIFEALLNGVTYGRDPWPELDLAIIFTTLVTGVRSAELLDLNIGSIDGPIGERRLHVHGKGDKDRTIPIEPGLEDVLDGYLASRTARFPDHANRRNLPPEPRAIDHYPATAPLFVSRSGERMQRGALQYLVRNVYRRAGVESQRQKGALVHALRHTMATRLIENPDTTVVQLMELLGHRSLATTQNYVKAAGREVRAVAASNPAYARLPRG